MRIPVIVLVLWPLLSWAQLTATTEPQRWHSSTMLDFGMGFSRVDLSHNSPEAIRAELLDATLIRRIGKAIGLTDPELATVRVVAEPDREWISLYQLDKSNKAFDALADTLREYVRARQDGHTKEFMQAAGSNRLVHAANQDAGLRAITNSRPWIPIAWLKLDETGATTNKAGREIGRTTTITEVDGKTVTNEVVDIPKTDEVRPWASYTLVDGDLCWRYFVQFRADGSVAYVHDSKCDAKDVDPKYKALMQEVGNAVKDDMKKEGSSGQFGSCHRFWELKKERLKAKGVDWRSPSEVNPGTCYD